MSSEPISFTREEFYNEAWSAPMVKLANKFGFSDGGIEGSSIRRNFFFLSFVVDFQVGVCRQSTIAYFEINENVSRPVQQIRTVLSLAVMVAAIVLMCTRRNILRIWCFGFRPWIKIFR